MIQQNGSAKLQADGESAIRMVEDVLTSAMTKFESAMSEWSTLLEQNANRVQRVSELASKSKEELMAIRDSIAEAVEPLTPVWKGAVRTSKIAAQAIRRNPRPFLFTLFGLVGGCVLLASIRRDTVSPQLQIPSGHTLQ